MNPGDTERIRQKAVYDFAEFLSKKGLEICSFSKSLRAYWPNEGTSNAYFAEKFLEDR